VIVVEHRDRLARFGVEHLEAALAAQRRRVVVADPGETTDVADKHPDRVRELRALMAARYRDVNGK